MPSQRLTLLLLFIAFGLILLVNFKLFFMVIKLTDEIGHSIDKRINKRISELEDEFFKLKHVISVSTVPLKTKNFPLKVKYRNEESRKRILVTGGAGFVGSHLVDRLMQYGHEVIALDNFFTGRRSNLEQWLGHPNFMLVHHDITLPYFSEVDYIYHLASPASPPHYTYNPVKTLKTNLMGSINLLGLASYIVMDHSIFRRVKARILLASTSEVYGDPELSPQPETYWGRVNTVGPRSCYDEGKRASEALFVAYSKQENVNIRIARIFNTFGPRMHFNDGRVVSNFIIQSLSNKNITIYGDGDQSRSFQYIDDLIDGLIALMESNVTTPVNLGNPEEFKIKNFAVLIKNLVGSNSSIVYLSSVEDDPQQRRPDISKAKNLLGWYPKITLLNGLKMTINYFRNELNAEKLRLNQIDDVTNNTENEKI